MIKCPYCGDPVKMEAYWKGRGIGPSVVVYCDNDNCTIKPCTDAMNTQDAFADAKAWR